MSALRASNSEVVLELIKLGYYWRYIKAFTKAVEFPYMLKVVLEQIKFWPETEPGDSLRLVAETLEYAKIIKANGSVEILESWLRSFEHLANTRDLYLET